jgi:hypothetical protein
MYRCGYITTQPTTWQLKKNLNTHTASRMLRAILRPTVDQLLQISLVSRGREFAPAPPRLACRHTVGTMLFDTNWPAPLRPMQYFAKLKPQASTLLLIKPNYS